MPRSSDELGLARGFERLDGELRILGALARGAGDNWSFPIEGGDLEARQRVIRLAVNIAMYVLCSDYKDDQVHAGELMRRRGRATP